MAQKFTVLSGLTVSGVSSLGIFGALFWLFDRRVWRVRWLRRWLLVPDLNGTWECSGEMTQKDGDRVSYPWNGTVTIVQSWTGIAIILRTATSTSSSSGATIYSEADGRFRLIYHYANTPKIDQTELKRHVGLCDLVFSADLARAEGFYFNGHGRASAGTMQLTKTEVRNESVIKT